MDKQTIEFLKHELKLDQLHEYFIRWINDDPSLTNDHVTIMMNCLNYKFNEMLRHNGMGAFLIAMKNVKNFDSSKFFIDGNNTDPVFNIVKKDKRLCDGKHKLMHVRTDVKFDYKNDTVGLDGSHVMATLNVAIFSCSYGKITVSCPSWELKCQVLLDLDDKEDFPKIFLEVNAPYVLYHNGPLAMNHIIENEFIISSCMWGVYFINTFGGNIGNVHIKIPNNGYCLDVDDGLSKYGAIEDNRLHKKFKICHMNFNEERTDVMKNDTKNVLDEMEQVSEKDDNYIKMDGEYHEFEGGAIRYTKTGKGKFDLIPWEIMKLISDKIIDDPMIDVYTTEMDVLIALTHRDPIELIINITAVKYGDGVFTADAFAWMLRDLAIHYEKGAEKYGVDNWKKGIPASSFWDSGCRHTCQFINGMVDEPHWISAIWNMIGYLWTINKES